MKAACQQPLSHQALQLHADSRLTQDARRGELDDSGSHGESEIEIETAPALPSDCEASLATHMIQVFTAQEVAAWDGDQLTDTPLCL